MVRPRYKRDAGLCNKNLRTDSTVFAILYLMKASSMTGQLKLGVLAAATKAIALCLGWEFVSRSSAWINHTFVDPWG